ncbi:MAG: hypothetical protein HY535_00885 [Chloroflexi bacterium]|nr:hypothetical protein [Chloroflexota bacterium]
MSRKKALEYAERLLATPRSRVRVTLRQGSQGVTLLHQRRAITKCYLNRSGIRAATLMARVLGISVPPLGASAHAEVSTGVLWRAISISCLDFRKRESYVLVERLLEEAELMRQTSSEGV